MRISDWSSDVCSSDLADQCGGGREADGQAPLAGGQAEPEGDMSLARAAGTERDDILAQLDPFATRPLQHLHLVELLDGGQVDRKSVVSGPSASVRVDIGGSRTINKKNTSTYTA